VYQRSSTVVITSRANARVKAVRSLFTRKYRARTRLFPVEGVRLVKEAVAAGAEIATLIIARDLLTAQAAELADNAAARGSAATLEVTPEVLASIFPDHGGQGIAAVVHQRWHKIESIAPEQDSCFVAAKQVRQPWSMGNLVRTCDAVGGDGVILVGHSTDPYHPEAVRASLGTVFSQRLVRTSPRALSEWREGHGCQVVGASPAGDVDYWSITYETPLILYVGSERVGLSAEEQADCDVVVRIPMEGRCESHHVTVAASLILYEVLRQLQGGAMVPTRGSRDG
jgi:TrmH family RNA methyltransferase